MKYGILVLLLYMSTICIAERHKIVEKKIAVTPTQRIEIEGISGSDIHFRSWTNNEVAVKLRVSISSSDGEYEEEFINSAKITDFKAGEVVRVSFDADERRESKGFSLFNLFKSFYVEKKISGDIYVPRSNPLTTDMRYGTLTLEDMEGELNLDGVSNSLTLRNCAAIKKIENNYGTTVIENSGGNLRLNGTSSTVTISDFRGNAKVNADYSTVTINRINNAVTIEDKSGTVKVDDVLGNVTIDADYTSITVKNVKGFVDINSTSATIKAYTVEGIHVDAKYSQVEIGNVSGTAAKTIVVKGQSGSLIIEDAVGNLKIDNPYSDVDLKSIKGNVNLTAKSSSITGTGIAGDWNSRTEYCSIKLRKLSANTVEMTNKSEAIDIRMVNKPDSVMIDNEYGNVSLKMASGFSGSVDLDAEYGTIRSNLVLKQKSRGSSEYATGTVGSGTGSISIRTKSGDIDLDEE